MFQVRSLNSKLPLDERETATIVIDHAGPPPDAFQTFIDTNPVAATLAPGHQLRVDISGADFPLYDRNPNTAEGIFGRKSAIATEQVHHKPGSLSRIVLPVK